MTEAQLREALDRASAHVDGRLLAKAALEGRARRLRHRRSAVAGGAVLALVLPALFLLRDDPSPQTVDRPAPSPVPLEPVITDEADMGIQPVWDPFTVTTAPRRPSVLPERLDPPSDPPSVFEQPLPAAMVAWPQEGQALRLLGTDGQWRAVPGTESLAPSTLRDVVTPALSSDGRLVAMSAEEGLWVVDVTSGELQVVPWPSEISAPSDTLPGVRWMPGDEALLVLHWRTPWIVGLDGSDEDASYLGRVPDVAVDPAGPLLQRRYRSGQLVEWHDGEIVRRVDDGVVWGGRMVAGEGLVALTGGLGGGTYSGPVVVDPGTGERVAYAPIRDRNSEYSDNGFLTAQGFLDPDTLLLLVGPINFRTMDIGEEQWHLVAWEFRSGDFELLTSGDTRMRGIEVAPSLMDPS